jgi:chromate reductase
VRILGISGSLRKDSHNTALLRAAAEQLPPGVELELYQGLRDIPPYDQDEDDAGDHHPAVLALREAIDQADAVLISTPEYNHSIPGVLKVLAAIGADVVDRELPVMQAHALFDEYGNLVADDLRDQLTEHVAALVEAVRERNGAGATV